MKNNQNFAPRFLGPIYSLLSKLFPYDASIDLQKYNYHQTRSRAFKVLGEEESRLNLLEFKGQIRKGGNAAQ